MVFSYIRVSTDGQTVENQRLEIQKFAAKRGIMVHEWCEETISTGKNLKKRKIYEFINNMRAGDILIVSELSRMARKLFELMELLQLAMQRDIKLLTVKEGYELGDNISSKVMAFAFGLSAEIERNMISERTKAGLARTKANGTILGRRKGSKAAPDKTKLGGKGPKIVELLAQKVSVSAIARIMGVHRLTVAAYIKNNDLEEKVKSKLSEKDETAKEKKRKEEIMNQRRRELGEDI